MARRDSAQRDSKPDRFHTVTAPSVDVDPVKLETHQVHSGWVVKAEWLPIDGRFEPIEVSVKSAPANSSGEHLPNRALNADVIRRLPIGEMLADGRVALTNIREDHHLLEGWPRDLFDDDVDIGKPQRGQTLTADDLEQVATVYRRAWAEGRPVNQAVRDTFHLSKDGAAKRIGKARAAGLLDGIGPKR